jgi:hypothetical protein
MQTPGSGLEPLILGRSTRWLGEPLQCVSVASLLQVDNETAEECSCRRNHKIGIMLPSTSISMTWNGRWVGSRTGRSFSFIRDQIAPLSQTPVSFATSPEQVIPSFAQVWYILEGEMSCGGTNYGPGTFVYMPDPHFEHEMTTKQGCTVVFLQYPGPTTGGRPLYDGRMNLKKAETPEQYDLNR